MTIGAPAGQAAFLRALADHMDAVSDLAVVNVSSDHRSGWDLHIVKLRNAAPELVDWAKSLDVPELTIQVSPQQVTAEFRATIGVWSVMVWGCVNALRDTIGPGIGRTISRSDLEHFVQHRELPGGAR